MTTMNRLWMMALLAGSCNEAVVGAGDREPGPTPSEKVTISAPPEMWIAGRTDAEGWSRVSGEIDASGSGRYAMFVAFQGSSALVRHACRAARDHARRRPRDGDVPHLREHRERDGRIGGRDRIVGRDRAHRRRDEAVRTSRRVRWI